MLEYLSLLLRKKDFGNDVDLEPELDQTSNVQAFVNPLFCVLDQGTEALLLARKGAEEKAAGQRTQSEVIK